MAREILICFALTLATCFCDHMIWTEYWKICNLANELLVASKNKIHQTDAIRDQMSKYTGFEVGMIMGRIRDKYRSMLELYRMAKNKFNDKPKQNFPSMPVIRPLYYLVRMEYLHALEVEIDNLVRILEAMPLDKIKLPKKIMRTGQAKEIEKLAKMKELEEDVKSKNREEYHLRKWVGLNNSSFY